MKKTQDDIESRCVLKNRIEGFSLARFVQTGGFDNEIFHEWQRMGKRIATNSLVFVFLFVAICGIFLFVGIRGASAADLSFVPAAGSYKVGDTFPVSIVVSSADKAMNAASARVLFPPSKLEVTHIGKGSSVLDLWIQEPAYSNNAGTIDFEGISFNPGYQGVRGELLTVTFKVKSSGTVPLSFAYGSVLANDGQGTDILTSLGSALFDIAEGSAVSAPVSPPASSSGTKPSSQTVSSPSPTTAKGAPSAPRVYSPTHPDPKGWYAETVAVFDWVPPLGVTASRLLWGRNDNAMPNVLYNDALDSKTIELADAEDGVYYFHVQLRNGDGWSSVTHYQFNVDRTPPDTLSVMCVNDGDTCSGSFKLTSSDARSGISHYLVQVDDRKPELWRNNSAGTRVWDPPFLRGGTHILSVTAVDKAGNTYEKRIGFEAMPQLRTLLGFNSRYKTLWLLVIGIFAVLAIGSVSRKNRFPVPSARTQRMILRALLLPLWWTLRLGFYLYYRLRRGRQKTAYAKKKITKPKI